MARRSTTFNRHLQEIDESYAQHLAHALGFAGKLALAALCCLIHALLPFLFEKTGSRLVNSLYQDMVRQRATLSRHNCGDTGGEAAGKQRGREAESAATAETLKAA